MKKLLLCTCSLLLSAFLLAQTDRISTPQWRPAYHFAPLKTWTNDPNGLFYFNNDFHLYYQNNPFDNIWGHMSWGHAVSKDLVHWKYLPVAIPEVVKPDSTISIFSGSAVIDYLNTSGFAKGKETPVVAIFTGDLPKQKREAQYIAYSNDTGKKFSLYSGNPVIDLDRPDFRDPNVFWYTPAKQWIMVVSLVHEHKIRFYTSSDLKSWSVLSDFGPAGYTNHDWECPSLIPITVDGSSSKIKWVLLVSCWGERCPYMQYFVGDFDGKTFYNSNPTNQILTLDDGDCFYAAIPWRLKHNKQILIGWLVPGKIATNPWRGQMSVPRDLSLHYTNDGLRLFQQPTSIIQKKLTHLSGNKNNIWNNIVLENKTIKPKGMEKYKGNSYWIDATFNLKQATKVGINIAEDSIGHKVIIGYDVNRQILFVDCSSASKEYKSSENLIQSTLLNPVDGKVKLQILFDKSSLEVFGNKGQKVITTMLYSTKDETGVSLFSEGNAIITQLSVWDLSKANNEKLYNK